MLQRCLSDENGVLVSVMIQVILSCHLDELFEVAFEIQTVGRGWI